MKELFEKVSSDTALQEKFSAIMNDAQSGYLKNQNVRAGHIADDPIGWLF